MYINKVNSLGKSIAFGGHKKVVDESGIEQFKFFLPFDSKNYKASVELYNVKANKKGDFVVQDPIKPVVTLPLNEKGEAELYNADTHFYLDKKFAYRYKLTPTKGGEAKYAFDPGIITDLKHYNSGDNKDNSKFNVAFLDRTSIATPGPMMLIMPDEFYPGMQFDSKGNPQLNQALRDKALDSTRTHINKLGGNLSGIVAKLPELEQEGYRRIVGMPLTKDTLSSHLYWTQNAYQLAPQLGNAEDFKTMQKGMFKHGMNWVSDAALVNEGPLGVHFSHVLKWGKQSPFFNWFKIDGLDNGVISVGVLPKKSDMVRFKLVNSPFSIDKDGKTKGKKEGYDATAPTYVQLYDDRLAGEKQKTDNNLIMTYDKNNTDNTYDITGHDDTVYPYYFEVDPSVLEKNIHQYTAQHKGTNLQNADAIRNIMSFENYRIADKAEGGFETWDGNVDIAKLCFTHSAKDNRNLSLKNLTDAEKQEAIQDMRDGVYAVQDYAINSGRYWTKLTADIQMNHILDTLRGVPSDKESYQNKIQEEVKNGNLPKSLSTLMTPDVIENILMNYGYASKTLDSYESRQEEYITGLLMDLPLDSLPVHPDLTAVLTSSYITKRAHNQEELGASKIDMALKGNPSLPAKYRAVQEQADAFYMKDLTEFTLQVLRNLDVDLFDEDSNLTDMGVFVVNEITPEIAQFALLKSINPDLGVSFKDGYINLAGVKSEDTTIKKLGIQSETPEGEAGALIGKMRSNLKKIKDVDKESMIENLKKRIAGRSIESYKMAEAIMDRTESGLGWRIDATKDIASIDSVREGQANMADIWEEVIDFWKTYNQGVKEINPHTYTAAEITDLDVLFPPNGAGRFHGAGDAETKFLQETGITTTANYSYFFSLLPGLFSRSAENGGEGGFNNISELKNNLIGNWEGSPGFLFQMPLDGVINSYTFVGNHDKPRVLHGLALDMTLFHSDFSSEPHKSAAAYVLNKDIKDIDFDNTSSAAVAMGTVVKDAFNKAKNKFENLKDIEVEGEPQVSSDMAAIHKAIANLASGKFKNKPFDADAFGARPFEIVLANILEEAQRNGLKMSVKEQKEVSSAVLGTILKPAFDKYYSIYKMLVTLPGAVTDFAGDKLASTGYETKTKNYFQQNRNPIRWEWLDDANKQYVKAFNSGVNNILGLRNSKETSALNDGIPISLPMVDGCLPVLRYNDSGSTVISVYSTNGAVAEPKEMYRSDVSIDRINLSSQDNMKEGLAAGLTVGTKFKNKNSKDSSTYIVACDSNGYYLKNKDANKKIVMTPEDYNTLVLYKAA